jgi:hypothetical protein
MGKKDINNQVFDMMTVAADKTDVDLEKPAKLEKSTKSIHTALMAAGMTPAYGNIADLADATLYALEGELGNAAWSAAAAIPIIGQMVSGKRALKVAKEAGEEMVTLYRGVDKWFPGKMVKEGKFVGGKSSQTGIISGELQQSIEYVKKEQAIFSKGGVELGEKAIWLTDVEDFARHYSRTWKGFEKAYERAGIKRGFLLEFEVPKSYLEKEAAKGVARFVKLHGKKDLTEHGFQYVFEEGIPKEFLKKIHK